MTALQTLLDRLIDYAGLFPPAGLPIETALSNFVSYQTSKHSWMLNSFVSPEINLVKIPDSLDGRLALLADKDLTRAASLETKDVVQATRPVYCEVSTGQLERLAEVKQSNCYAKIRMGGLKPEAFPTSEQVTSFILRCVELKLPFKATAGLHHPIRADYALTYDVDSAKTTMHGFLNLSMAAAFAWAGMRDLVPILQETDAQAFKFDADAYWRGEKLSVTQIRDARQNFFHSIGSCSFEEPVQELQALGLLD